MTTADFELPAGASIVSTGSSNEFIISGLADGESVTIDTAGGSTTTFNGVSVSNGADESDGGGGTYGGDDFTLGLLGVDFPQYVGGTPAMTRRSQAPAWTTPLSVSTAMMS